MINFRNNSINFYFPVFLLAFACWNFASCSTTHAPASSKHSKTGEQAVLHHVVAFTFKEDVSATEQDAAVKRFLALKDEIPQILSFEGGKDVSVEGFDKGLKYCFVLTFADEAARDIYLPHPAHDRVVAQNKPLIKDLLVLDFIGEK